MTLTRLAHSVPDDFDYVDLEELLDVITHLCEFLHPGTSHSEPGDYEALLRAQAILNRYTPAQEAQG